MPDSDATATSAPLTRREARQRRDVSTDMATALERHNRRIGWMDCLRGLAILLVVLHHSTQIVTYRIAEAPAVFGFLSEFFAPFRMPLLMFLSGLLVAGSLHRPAGAYVWGKIRRILWPIIVWTFIYQGMQTVVDGDPFAWYTPEFWNGYLWFMQFVGAYYIIALLLRWIPAWILVIVPFAGMILLPADTLGQRFFYLMPFFFLGAFIEKHWDQYARLLSFPVAAMLCVIPLGVALYSGLVTPLWYTPLAAIPAMIGIVVLVRASVAIPDARWLAPVRFVGRYSLIYYCAHYPVFAALGWIAQKAGLDNPTIALIAVFAATLAISTVFAILGRRMPVSLLFELPRRLWPARAA